MRLSIVVPTLNEGALIETLLRSLAPLCERGHQLIVSDGGSTDDTLARAARWADTVVGSPGRAVQMNRGAALAQGDWLWFVHADSGFDDPPQRLAAGIAGSARDWGRFAVRLDDPAPVFRLIETLMNRRSCMTGIATGDQGLFVRRDLFAQVGGFPEQPLMEDIELSRRLKRHGKPDCRQETLVVSARRWRRDGVLRTVGLMWQLRLRYFLGVPPQRLAERYRLCSSPTRES
jgi:rSAM/selenodomain-associated transferase 2